MINTAIEVALEAHKNQFRKGTKIPYVTHPLAVGIMLAKTGCSDEVIVAGILHDTVEGTPITLDYLHDTFGKKCPRWWKAPQNPIDHCHGGNVRDTLWNSFKVHR